MGLKEDRRAQLGGGPGIHAFIAGVSDYRHFEGGSDVPAAEMYGFKALRSTARTAALFYDWLLKADAAGRLPLPLATVHLLLSPSKSEENELAALKADRCSWGNFVADAHGWRDSASASNQEMTIFYFAGHGVGRVQTEALLLMDDVGARNAGVFVNRCVDTRNLFDGMAPPPSAARSIARTQFYFIDACRTPITELREFELNDIPQIWNVYIDGKDNRAAPIFFGSVSGESAYTSEEKQTLFSMALFDCFDRFGAIEPTASDPNQLWRITTASLIQRLDAALDEIQKQFGVPQGWAPGGVPKEAIFGFLSQPPDTTITLTVDPAEAAGVFQVDVFDPSTQNLLFSVTPLDPHPHIRRLKVGTYRFSARLTNATAPYRDYAESIPVQLPQTSWRAKVSP